MFHFPCLLQSLHNTGSCNRYYYSIDSFFCSKPNSVKKTTIDPESLNQIASIDNDDAIEVIAPEKVNSPQTSFNTLLRWGIVPKTR